MTCVLSAMSPGSAPAMILRVRTAFFCATCAITVIFRTARQYLHPGAGVCVEEAPGL
jgi:hypothetical protein